VENFYFCALILNKRMDMVVVAQLVRASDCGSEGRGFESRHPPKVKKAGFFSCPELVTFG
jgi:hypothetical protein